MNIIIDYGMGNGGSILNMIRHVGSSARISSEINEIESAKTLILPGVGAFDNAIQRLNDSGIADVIKRRVLNDDVRLFGICLGMQLLFESSEEGRLAGLGLLRGRALRFAFHDESQGSLKVPHMGWNTVRIKSCHSAFSGLDETPRFYFVHSYYVECADSSDVLATTEYGLEFACAVAKGRVFATQFHPEKSHKYGMQLFKNYLRETK